MPNLVIPESEYQEAVTNIEAVIHGIIDSVIVEQILKQYVINAINKTIYDWRWNQSDADKLAVIDSISVPSAFSRSYTELVLDAMISLESKGLVSKAIAYPRLTEETIESQIQHTPVTGAWERLGNWIHDNIPDPLVEAIKELKKLLNEAGIKFSINDILVIIAVIFVVFLFTVYRRK